MSVAACSAHGLYNKLGVTAMTIFISNKYTLWYFNLIKKRQTELLADCYTERHHIIPKCLGGDDSDENLVSLSAREHVVAHWLLTKMVDKDSRYKMLFAFNTMSRSSNDQERRLTPLEISKSKAAKLQAMTEYYSSPMWSYKWSQIKPKWAEAMRKVNLRPEVKHKRSQSQKIAQNRADVAAKRKERLSRSAIKEQISKKANEVWSRPGVREKHSVLSKEIWNRPGMKEKYRNAAKECQNRPEVKAIKSAMLLKTKKTCPHCNKTGNPLAMHRWHFDRCRLKKGEGE